MLVSPRNRPHPLVTKSFPIPHKISVTYKLLPFRTILSLPNKIALFFGIIRVKIQSLKVYCNINFFYSFLKFPSIRTTYIFYTNTLIQICNIAPFSNITCFPIFFQKSLLHFLKHLTLTPSLQASLTNNLKSFSNSFFILLV